MLTATGKAFNLGHPQATDICLDDLAHQLALINRFNGATGRPYSVAEHSLLVVDILETELGMTDPSGLLAGLMHDAHEIYFGDVISPVKHYLGDTAQVLEWSLQGKVQERYGLRTASRGHHDEINRADLIALATERRDLLPPHPMPWPILNGIEPARWADLQSTERSAVPWQYWRKAFAAKFHVLNMARVKLIGATGPIDQ
jgi:hypothetical protein